MAMIPLSSGFQVIPEGRYVFQITDVDYNKDFGKLTLTLETHDSKKVIERYSLLNSNGEINTGAQWAFTLTARAAMNNDDLEEIEHTDLIDRFFEATVTHDVRPSKKHPGQPVTYIKLSDKSPSNGFGKIPDGFDLNSIPGWDS